MQQASKPATKPGSNPVLGETALAWGSRLVWLMCIGVYLMVFVGGVRDGGDELLTMARAIGFTLVVGVLGHKALGLLARATVPNEEEKGLSADQAGQVGSLVDLVGSTNVAQHEDEAAPA